jgi:hypothetical protein
MKVRRLFLLALMLFIVSCNGKSGSKVVSTDFVQTETENRVTAISKQPQSDISNVSEKMQKQKKLTNPDFDCICDFLFNNNDESKSEEIVYQLFDYLKGKPLNNSDFISYLNEKGSPLKEKALTALIQIMCIDIGEENYSYDNFIKDFYLFNNNAFAKKAFNECMGDQ